MEKKIYNLFLYRDTYTNKSTVGKLFFGDDFFCHTLEDKVRPAGIKIPGETAIPEGVYKVTVTRSHRFKRDMPLLSNQPNGYEIKKGSVSYKGVRLHGGNSHKNTAGCPLCAYNRINDDYIQGTAEKELTKKIKDLIAEGYEIQIWVTNFPEAE